MDNYLQYLPDDSIDYGDKIEGMYPESYRRLYPHIQDIVDTLTDDDVYNMTQADLNRYAEQAIRKSGLAVRQSAHKAQSVIGDIAGILLLREFFDRFDRRRPIPYVVPFYPYPGYEHRAGRGRGRFGRY